MVVGPDQALYISSASDPSCINVYVQRQEFDNPLSLEILAEIRPPQGTSCHPRLAVAADGTIYVKVSRYLYRVAPGGQVALVHDSNIDSPSYVAVGRDGSVYFTSISVIDRLRADGRIERVAGTGTLGFSGDGGQATASQLGHVGGLISDADGSLFIFDGQPLNSRIRKVAADGTLTTVGGGGSTGALASPSIDGSPAVGASLLLLEETFAQAPDGGLYIVDSFTEDGSPEIRRLAPIFGEAAATIQVPSQDGSEIYEFSDVGRHLRTRHALTGAVTYAFQYDAIGRLTRVTDGDGLETQIQRNLAGRATEIVAPFGQRTTLEIDSNGYLAAVADPAGHTTRITSRPDGLIERFTAPNNYTSTFQYDTLGRLIRDENAAQGLEMLGHSSLGSGWLATSTTAMSRVRSYLTQRLATGEWQTANTEADGVTTTQLRRSDASQQTDWADGTRVVATAGPDPRFGLQSPVLEASSVRMPSGLMLSTNRSRSATLANPNDLFSLQTQTETTVVNGRLYRTVLDAATKTLTATSPAGRTATLKIDSQGRITEVGSGTLTPVTLTYDPQGRLAVVRQGTRESTVTYDNFGRASLFTDAMSHSTTFGYDASDRVTTLSLEDQGTTQIGYDANSNITSITPPGRPAHSFAQSPADLTTSYTPPTVSNGGQGATLYDFNVDQQPTLLSRPDGQSLVFTHGATDGRLNSITFSRGQLEYGYDVAGRVSSLTDPSGVNLSYTYDSSLPLSETWSGPVFGSVSRTCTANFEVASERINNGPPVSFDYDSDRLLTQAGALVIGRDQANAGPISTTLESTTEVFDYNEFGELRRQRARFAGVDQFDVEYTHDSLGRITQRIERIDGLVRIWHYSYDSAGRLERVRRSTLSSDVIAEQYSYDTSGNRLTDDPEGPALPIPATYDDQDRLEEYGNAAFSYTANGELASKIVGTQTTVYDYDTLGNLTEVVLPDQARITYTVDGRGRRVAKTIDGVRVKGWLYAGQLRPIAELDGDGNVVSRFVFGSRMNVPDYMIRGGVTYRIFSDHVGGPRIVLNASTGQVVQRLDFTAFGEVIQDSNPGWQPFGFAGGLYDADTSLLRFGIRDYDAHSGRWLSKDPIGFGAGENFYSYAGQDPVNFVDPDGRDVIVIRYLFFPIDTGVKLGQTPLLVPAGHAGIVTLDETTGQTRYYEYGRYDPEDFGVVMRRQIPNVKIGKDGLPTQDSLQALYDHLSKAWGKDSRVLATYDAEADFDKANKHAESVKNNPNRPRYRLWSNNCYTFAEEVRDAAKK